MSDAERFDACYAESRDRLLALAFALTGDLAASRGAVRDTFVAAWHHWSKLERLEDPQPWLRRHVWSRAQRRHAARLWHRDRKLDPELKATLGALGKLSTGSRKALLLSQLADASSDEIAEQAGVRSAEAEDRVVVATEQFARERSVAATGVRAALDPLVEHCADERWSRATIVRRAGTARRRTHTTVGALLVVGAVVGSGVLVTDAHGVHPTLSAAGDRLTAVTPGGPGGGGASEPEVSITASSLVSSAQLDNAVRGGTWRVTGTDPKQGMAFPCQRRTHADPHAATALMRTFTARRQRHQPQLAAVQATELSTSLGAAHAGYVSATSWFASCAMPQTQLVTVRRVQRLGDEAEQYVLRTWGSSTSMLVLGAARTGQLTTLTLTRSAGSARPDLAGNLRLLATAVDNLCVSRVGGQCSATPRPVTVPPPRTGTLPMMLGELDLPPVTGVSRPWVGTTAGRALTNVAATGCDRSSFHGHGFRHGMTRSFLVPGGHLAAAFGITETVGRLPVARARSFVAGVRAKMASCSDRELGTKVQRLAAGSTWATWRVRTQVMDKQTVTFYMGVVRSGGALAQVGFVPDGRHTMSTPDFVALVHRAGERLAAMPS